MSYIVVIDVLNKCRQRSGEAVLCGDRTENGLMCLEGSGYVSGRRVETQCDGCRVLVRRIECVVQVHEKRVAAPAEAILNEGIREAHGAVGLRP